MCPKLTIVPDAATIIISSNGFINGFSSQTMLNMALISSVIIEVSTLSSLEAISITFIISCMAFPANNTQPMIPAKAASPAAKAKPPKPPVPADRYPRPITPAANANSTAIVIPIVSNSPPQSLPILSRSFTISIIAYPDNPIQTITPNKAKAPVLRFLFTLLSIQSMNDIPPTNKSSKPKNLSMFISKSG